MGELHVKILSRCLCSVLAGLSLVAAPAVSAQQTEASGEQWMERMQSHWQKVISETDTQKRTALMREHEQLMSEAMESERGDSGTGGHHGMDMGSGHVHMMNTVDMHRRMLDMMR